MKIFISYENLKRDFNGRMLLLSKLAKFKDVEEIYVKDTNVKIEGNKKERVIKATVFFKEPEYETEYPVILQSRLTGNNIVVYYAKDNYKKERFMSTKKYQYAFKTGDWGLE